MVTFASTALSHNTTEGDAESTPTPSPEPNTQPHHIASFEVVEVAQAVIQDDTFEIMSSTGDQPVPSRVVRDTEALGAFAQTDDEEVLVRVRRDSVSLGFTVTPEPSSAPATSVTSTIDLRTSTLLPSSPVPTASPVVPICDFAVDDIVFMLDGSVAAGLSGFERQIDVVKEIVSLLPIGQGQEEIR